MHRRKIVRIGLSVVLASVMLFLSAPVCAEDIASLESKTSDLQEELDDINQELLDISDQIASTEAEIEAANNEMLRIQDSLAISRENEARQYEDMKARIKYMYENGSASLLELLFSAENMTDFLNKADFIQNISSYDRQRLESLQGIHDGIEQQETDLKAEQASLTDLQEQLENQQDELRVKADETSTDLNAFQEQLQAMREEEARKAEEAAKAAKAASEAAAKSAAAQTGAGTSSGTGSSQAQGNAGAGGSQASAGTGSGSQSGNYTIPSGSNVLTPSKGVVYFNGHRETYYSQKVLPGGGLNIPGRHVAEDGTIRDADGYICVASSDYPRGTIVETSLGTGKVYDTGCASGTIDIYTDW